MIAGFYLGEALEGDSNGRALVLQHTDELIEQNQGASSSITGGSSFESEWSGERICRRCKNSTSWRNGLPVGMRSVGR